MTATAARVWLKVADATALTAKETLQRALGYGRRLQEVHRSELWTFRWEAVDDPLAPVERLVRETNLLLNPNKHHFELATGQTGLRPRGNAWVLVFTPGEGRSLETVLGRHRLVTGRMPEIRRARLWELEFAADPAELATLAGEVGVARSRTRGLLSNPHVEDAVVWTTAPTADEVAARLFASSTAAG